MATTLYLPSSGTPPLAALAVNSNWELTNSLVRRPCFISKINSALATTALTWPATSTQQWCWFQFQSDVLAAAYSWTTADTVSMVIGKCGEPAALTADTHLAYVVRVVSGDGSSIRGVIGLYHATSTEFPDVASAATRIHSARVNGAANFSSQIGDRIIIELGMHGVTPAAVQVQMRVGDPSATGDFALTAGLTTDLCPWVRLSRDVVFGRSITAVAGSHDVTGTVTPLLKSSIIGADGGSDVLNGQSVSLLKSSIILAEADSYNINGTVANLLLNRLVGAETGAIIFTGQDVTLTKTTAGYTLTCDAGTVELTGQVSSLLTSRLVSAGLGEYTTVGSICSLLKSYLIGVENGNYILNGQDCFLLYHRVLTTESGNEAFTGQQTSLLISRLMQTEVGDYALTGMDVILARIYSILADAGAIVLNGQDIDFFRSYILGTETGSIVLSGQLASLITSRVLSADEGHYKNIPSASLIRFTDGKMAKRITDTLYSKL